MLSDMNINKINAEIEKIKKQISSLGPLRPGTMYERLSVCGKPGCRCSRKRRPIKHGPYYYLSYTFRRKSYTEFVSAKEVAVVKRQIRNYEKLMNLVKKLIDYSIKLARSQKAG
jgi:hypothetical protein